MLYSVSRGIVISSFPLVTPANGNGSTKGAATIRLTPDGKNVVAWETQHVQGGKNPFWTPASALYTEFIQRESMTGKVDVYDAESGRLLNTLTLPGSAGPAPLGVAFSPDSQTMYYGVPGHVYAVDLSGTKPPQVLPAKGWSSWFFFASR